MSYIINLEIMPSPPMISYYDLLGGSHPDGKDIWLTEADLKVLRSIPGVPNAYAAEERAGLVLYVRGVPFTLSCKVFRDIFTPFGEVNKSPVLISLSSQETFRWVIMKHAHDARDAKRALHGSEHESGGHLFISMAMEPGMVFQQVDKLLPKGRRVSNGNTAPTIRFDGHGHPLPPSLGSSQPRLLPFPQNLIPILTVTSPGIQDSPASIPPPGVAMYPAALQQVGRPSPHATPALLVPQISYARVPSRTSSAPSRVAAPGSRRGIIKANKLAARPGVPHPASWANVASSSDPRTRVIDLNPENKSQNLGPRPNISGRAQSSVPVLAKEEPLQDQMRLIFLLNLPQSIGLQEITKAITEGPLVRIQFGHDNDNNARFVGIIFQYACHAREFYNELIQEAVRKRPKRFCFIADVVRGDPVPADQTILSMNGSPYATRRLTIVKGKFFFIIGERQLRDLCCKVSGEESIQQVWVYNGGNATVVFADVGSAIKVKRALDKKANASDNGERSAEANIWKGLQTTFSKDPCIFPLDLKTVMYPS